MAPIVGMGLRIVRINAAGNAQESVTPATATLETYATVQAGTQIGLAAAKTPPGDGDTFPVIDSANGNVLSKVTWANIKATMHTYLAALTDVWAISISGNAATAAALSQGTHGYTLTAEQSTTSGTSIDFTGIPAWATKIWVLFNGVSTTGVSPILIQIGPAGAPEIIGYNACAIDITGAPSTVTLNPAMGFPVEVSCAAASIVNGVAILLLENAAAFRWSFMSTLSQVSGTTMKFGSGIKSCAAALNRIRITTAGGTDTFDLGAISIAYE